RLLWASVAYGMNRSPSRSFAAAASRSPFIHSACASAKDAGAKSGRCASAALSASIAAPIWPFSRSASALASSASGVAGPPVGPMPPGVMPALSDVVALHGYTKSSGERLHVAAHRQRLSADVLAGVGGEEQRHVGDVVRTHRSAERNLRDQLVPVLILGQAEHLRLGGDYALDAIAFDEARLDRIDAD